MPLPKSIHNLNRTLHIYLTMFALVLLIFYSLTGLMLNHPEFFGLDAARITRQSATLPTALFQDRLQLVEHLRKNLGATGELAPIDDADPESLRLQFNSPGRKSDFILNPATGAADITHESHGLAGLLTDLHTGKHTSFSWKRIIDATSILLLLASLTGLLLWTTLPKRRKLGLLALTLSLALVGGVYYLLLP